ncbi:hypothetical protein [Ramlibacter sp.]|uniref:hypothetical protein n=1 Tax=Ramlibacter sp. TaxID=1917967 RepID=UPI00180A0EBC|nr:hypothetical protein [Ramlibacter sp.]MBA2674609.1 hypothetical protein [Ramlibacter sp.]
MKYKPLLIALASVGAIAVLAIAGGPGGWAAAGLFAVVAGYLLLRRPSSEATSGHEHFFNDAGEETALPDLRTPANDSCIDAPPAREHKRR